MQTNGQRLRKCLTTGPGMPGGLSGKGFIEVSIFVLFLCAFVRFVEQNLHDARTGNHVSVKLSCGATCMGNLNIAGRIRA